MLLPVAQKVWRVALRYARTRSQLGFVMIKTVKEIHTSTVRGTARVEMPAQSTQSNDSCCGCFMLKLPVAGVLGQSSVLATVCVRKGGKAKNKPSMAFV